MKNSRDIVCGSFALLFILYSVTSTIQLYSVQAQTNNWKIFWDPDQRFIFKYPPDWIAKSTHDNNTRTTQVILSKPNSTRFLVTVLYNPDDSLLSSKTNKTVVPSRALTNLETQIGRDYVFFNSTGKFPHKYSIQNFSSASDIIDFEKSEGKRGKMLIVFAKINEKDSFQFMYSDSRALFYRNLGNVSQIIKSITT